MNKEIPSGDFLSSPRRGVFFFLALIIPICWMSLIRILAMPDGESANDAYYHAAMAEQGPSVFLAKKFPSLELSVWRDTFADKELLYHFLLYGLFRVQKLFIPAVQAPFHFPAICVLCLLTAALLFAMKRMGVSPPLYLPMVMLSLMSASNVMFRVLMLRPHVLSLILMFLLCGMLSGGSLRSRLLWSGVISVFYAWSYSNPQFILIPVLFFAVAGIRDSGWKNLWLIGASAGGVLLGLLLHPQFPNSFMIWKVQSLTALVGPLLSPGTFRYATLLPPQEMMAPGVLWNCRALPMYGFAYVNFLIFSRLAVHRGWKNIPSHYYAVGGLSLLFTIGTFLVLRTIEYAGPFAGLFGSLVWSMALKERIFLPGTGKPVRFCLVLTLLVFLMASWSSVLNIGFARSVTYPATGIGGWLDRNLPPKTLVVNLSWGDFPPLYQAARKPVFLWGMDPEFSYAADPKRSRRIELFLLNRGEMTPRRFRTATGAKYAVLLARREKFVEFLKQLGWRTLYEAEDGAVLVAD